MMRFLKDPVWTFVAVIVGVIAIVVTIVLSDRPIKKLRVDILSNSPLVSINTEAPKELQILYKAKPVQTLSVILLRLVNTGTEPIRESDYSEPIRMSLSRSAEIGEVVVQETRPDGIPLAPTVIASNQVELGKFLFNPGDQAVLKILALNNDATLDLKGRIAGVREIEIQSVLERSNPNDPLQLWKLLALGFILSVLIIVPMLIWQSRKVMKWRQQHFGFNPASYFYTLAQRAMLSVPAPTTATLTSAIYYLNKAFDWDTGYIERAATDSLFSSLQGYEPYRIMRQKHWSRMTASAPA